MERVVNDNDINYATTPFNGYFDQPEEIDQIV
jgi:hypothetical protein